MSERTSKSVATAFTIGVHGALALALFLSMAWKRNLPPTPILSAEIFAAPPKAEVVEPPPPSVVEPPPAALQTPPPAPVETQNNAEIVLKKQAEEKAAKEKLRVEAEREKERERKAADDEKRAKEKIAAEKLAKEREATDRKNRMQREADRDATMRAMLAEADTDKKSVDQTLSAQLKMRDDAERKEAKERAERAAREAEAARKDADAKAAQAAAAQAAQRNARSLDEYVSKIRNKVKGNIVYAQDIPGKPSAEFSITQLPSGEVVSISLRRSSGNRALDDAIERAIQKSSPLPKPDNPELFQRSLVLTVRPNDG